MKLPRPISNLINNFERLPGIGPKTAQRLVFSLLHYPQHELENFATSLISLKKDIKLCSLCKNVDEKDPCSVCVDELRTKTMICVVATSMDAFALERAGFKGLYHVLHGVIDPLNNIGPDEIFIKELVSRLKNSIEHKLELILATNTGMEGESTAMYISKLIKDDSTLRGKIKITRLARGLPVGGDIEYADDTTLFRALEGRTGFN